MKNDKLTNTNLSDRDFEQVEKLFELIKSAQTGICEPAKRGVLGDEQVLAFLMNGDVA